MSTADHSFCSLVPLRFICDEMLHGLGDWLRVAGYDTLAPEPGLADVAILALAIAEDRWLITRDRGLQRRERAASYVILLKGATLQDNLEELTRRLDLDWLYNPFSRCKSCNTTLLKRDKASAGQRVPNDIPEGDLRFCPDCDHYYWTGSHVKRMRERLLGLNARRRIKIRSKRGS